MAQPTKTKNSEAQFARTKANKVRKLTREVKKNPNNVNAKKALEFWQTHDRKVKKHGR